MLLPFIDSDLFHRCALQCRFVCTRKIQGRIQDFKLGGGAPKNISPSGGRRENIWGISCEKSRFYAIKTYFFPILGGGKSLPPPWIRR